MSQAKTAALARVEAERDSAISFLQSLIRLQPTGEAAIQETLAQRLEKAGATIDRLAYEPSEVPVVEEFATGAGASVGKRASVVGTFPAGNSQGRSLMLFAHPDGEMIRDLDSWNRDPFAAVIEKGRLYGWGVADDLTGIATAIVALEAIKAAGITLAGEVVVASTPSKRHARGVAAVLHHGYSADAAIYLHPAESGVGMNEIKAFTSGQLEFSISVKGREADTTEKSHTAFAHLAVSALDKAFELIAALKRLDAERGARIHHPLLEAAVGRSTNIMVSSLRFSGAKATTRISTELVFDGSISFPPPETVTQVQAEVTAALEQAIAADPWLRENRPEIDWLSGVSGMAIPFEHPLYRIVSGAVIEQAGVHPIVNPMHTSSDIRNPVVQKAFRPSGLGPSAAISPKQAITMSGSIWTISFGRSKSPLPASSIGAVSSNLLDGERGGRLWPTLPHAYAPLLCRSVTVTW
jgi:acetylornithine deacetylase